MEQRTKVTRLNGALADASGMFAVHNMFRREFGLMPRLVRDVTADDRPRATAVADHVALVSLLLHQHHMVEDRHIWPRLEERGTKEIASIVHVMEEQHSAIFTCSLQVREALEPWRQRASVGTRDALADAIDRLVPALKEHLSDEERCVVPLVEKYITAAEYAVLVQEAVDDIAPERLPTVFGMLMYETAPAVIDMIVAEMPAEVRPVIKDVAGKAYASYARDLYGTSIPPRAP